VSLTSPSALDRALAPTPPVALDDAIAPIEHLPKWLLCIPIGVQLFWLGARYGSVTLPSVLNPAIENGGLVGESKYSYLRLVGGGFRHLIPTTVLVKWGEDVEAARQAAGIAFPLIAKPDIGWCGYGVRRVDNIGELRKYASCFPRDASFLLQELVTAPHEAGVHYVRAPNEQRGRVVALTIRHPPSVVGDGVDTIGELIERNVRTRAKADFYQELLSPVFLARVPAQAERVVLTTVASTRIGGRYEDVTHRISPAFADTVDALCRSMGGFEYGRLDVRFDTLEALRDGRFKIIEINGAGSEAIQYWDPHTTMRQTFAGVFAKQRELYKLAAEARRAGRKPVGLVAILRAHFKQQHLIRQYPPSN